MSATVTPAEGSPAGATAVVADVEKGSEGKKSEVRNSISWQEAATSSNDEDDDEMDDEDPSVFACLHRIQEQPWAKSIDHFLSRNLGWSIVVMVLTVWALFMDDLLYLLLPKEADIVFLSSVG